MLVLDQANMITRRLSTEQTACAESPREQACECSAERGSLPVQYGGLACKSGQPKKTPRVLVEQRWLVASALLLSLSGGLRAEEAALDPATETPAQRQAAATFAELLPQEVQRAGDPDFDYRLGIAALDSGHINRAIFALERVVAVRPEDYPARAELGRAYLAAGETERARNALDLVRRAAIPAGAAVAIDRVLGALDQVAPSKKPHYFGYLEIGGGRDSNVTSAMNAGQFAIPAFGGLLFTVAPENGRRSDTFGLAAAGASVQMPLRPEWDLIAAVNARGVLNTHVHEQNTGVLDGTVGVRHGQGAHSQTLALQSSAAWVSSSRYRMANGLSAQWQSQLDPASQWSAFAQWSRQEYPGQTERNADRAVLGSAYAHSFAATGTLAYGSLYVAAEHARDSDFSYYGHRAAGLRIGGEQRLVRSTVAFTEWQYEYRHYRGTEPLFDRRRLDRQQDLIVGLRYEPAPQWQVIPQIRYTRTASNVVLYDYDRTIFQISLRREFR